VEHVFTIDQEVTFYYIRYKPDKEIPVPWNDFYLSYQLSGESRTTLSRLRTLLEGDRFSQRAGEHLLLYFLYSLLGNRKVETYSHGPVIKSQNYMAENLSKKLTLRELADHVHLEKHYFCRLFKENTNISPLAYFEKLKMEAACSMIEQGTRGYRVAENLGFCDETYFCHRFKKVVGLSPGEFRRKRKQGSFS
jgi:AraC-like DNA-binding protein